MPSFLARLRALFAPPPPRPHAYWDGEIALTLAKLVQETETRASGRVQLLSLAAFRAEIGELWDQYKDRILLIAETTIARRIGRGNTFIAQDEDSWLLLFPGLDEQEAQARADAIAETIGEKLVGARFALEETPLPEAAKLDLDAAINEDGSVNLDGLRTAVSRAKDKQQKIFGGPARRGQAAATPARPVTAPMPEPSRLKELTLAYRPIWSAETQAIDTFALQAVLGHAGVLDDGGPAINEATAIDLVRAGLEAFTAMRRAGLRAKFVLPVVAGALSPRALTEVQRLIAALPREDRLLTLRLAFHRLPARAGIEQLIALREVFRPYAREVAFPVNPFDLTHPAFALDHIVAMADVSAESQRIDSEFFEIMLRFKTRIADRVTCVVGLRRRSHLAKALAAGISEVGGPALGEEVRHLPERPEILLREHLLKG
jgi:hypothetical protein